MAFENFVSPFTLNDLRRALKFIGVFEYEKDEFRWPHTLRIIIITIILTIKILFCIASFMFSIQYHTLLEMFKSASFSYNSVVCTFFVYLYLQSHRDKIEYLISSWEDTFRRSKNFQTEFSSFLI